VAREARKQIQGIYMAQNMLATEQKSMGMEKPRAKTYRIPISNGIFEHYKRLKDSRWLLDLYIDWTTKEVPAPDGSRDGIVLGGKPIRDEDTASAFGCCPRTVRTWRVRLARFDYIEQLRTPVGYVIRVKKSKKWPERPEKSCRSDRQKVADHSESELRITADQNYGSLPIRPEENCRSNKDSAVQDRDRAVEDAATTAAGSSLKSKSRKVLKEAWENVDLKPMGGIRFCEAWEHFYGEATGSELMSDVMELAIQHCQSNGIRVPPPFFAAKRLVEKQESSEVISRALSREESDEVSRVAGPRGVPPELMR
jgi:hypothetical protein